MVASPSRRAGVHEFRVRMPRKLVQARFAPPAASRPPIQIAETPAPPGPETTPAVPQNFWNTDAGRELALDRERIELALTALREQLDSAIAHRNENLGSLQRAAIELATVMATRLLHTKIEAGSFPIEDKIRDMAEHLGMQSPLSIHLNPADIELLEARIAGAPLFPGERDPRIMPDPQLPRGGCRVESNEGMLMSELVRELDDIRSELLRSLDAHPRT